MTVKLCKEGVGHTGRMHYSILVDGVGQFGIGVAIIKNLNGTTTTRVWMALSTGAYEHTDHEADKEDIDWALEVATQKLVERKLGK